MRAIVRESDEAQYSILLVEDEVINAWALMKDLKNRGFPRITHVTTGVRAIRSCLSNPPKVILMDIHLVGGMDGIEAVENIRQTMDIPVIYISGYDDAPMMHRSQRTSPVAFLSKPVNVPELCQLIRSVLHM